MNPIWVSPDSNISSEKYSINESYLASGTNNISNKDTGISVDEKKININCEDGELRNLREYVLWALNGFSQKIECSPMPDIKDSEMLI